MGGLGVVFMSSIASAFLPPTTAMGAGLYSIALYGGLILFSGFLLYDTQRIIKKAENHPNYGYGIQKYDPVNNSISIFMDAVNIFVRIAQILAMGGNGRTPKTELLKIHPLHSSKIFCHCFFLCLNHAGY